MVVVPLSVVVTVINRDICPINAEELIERHLLGKLVNQVDKDIFCDKSEISDELRECPPGRWAL
ncbi:hypothetical protein [Haloarcula salinisoli]|uniref:Uncharacterized protein n=1 Tax=Haloarcula salinisoli TaxID=2487746 RepID=A0A8J7YKE1_9EURY|nr:hypothetical protein [Halomicroarcula salinisoli]MBX0287821.1 hypothetical protein [Halomicroarcula salinisoli]MBX0304764.1 hypothetical protein [Halomicroarcula salinisoli]